MRPGKDPPKRRTARPASPPGSRRSATAAPSATLLDRELASEPDTISLFGDLQISEEYANSNPEPRTFSYSVKQQCWDKAEKVKGRDPDRWRRDPIGNIVFRKLVGCPGCLCHDYDHIVPYSKLLLCGCGEYAVVQLALTGGKSTLENCQVLQAKVNRSKGNRTEISRADLVQKSTYCRVSGRDMDLIELSAYGNVRHAQDSEGCRIQ